MLRARWPGLRRAAAVRGRTAAAAAAAAAAALAALHVPCHTARVAGWLGTRR